MSVRCEPCPEQTFGPVDGNATCLPCASGTESSPGSSQCSRIIRTPMSQAFVIGLSVGAVALVGIIMGVASWCVQKNKRRDNTYAPKSAGVNPVAVIFTDIQASTNLWANMPEIMSQAVDDHHDIIRKIIAKHTGYEVKTIGDAFMIVHGDITSA